MSCTNSFFVFVFVFVGRSFHPIDGQRESKSRNEKEKRRDCFGRIETLLRFIEETSAEMNNRKTERKRREDKEKISNKSLRTD